MSLANVRISPHPLSAPESVALISALNAELETMYPEPGANHFRLDEEEVAPGHGVFLIAFLEGEPVACGGVRRLEIEGVPAAEIKRMYTRPEVRSRGVARALLTVLEAEAKDLGATRLMLATGQRQTNAIDLYARAGFTRTPPFGEYVGAALSVCMAKDL